MQDDTKETNKKDKKEKKEKKPKKYSLNIGLNSVDPNHYDGWTGNLVACEADANDMANMAKSKGFETPVVLLTPEATRDNVINAITDFARKLKSGDFFFLTYSGHGGHLPDRNGDETDRVDETWVLYDGELVDDELYLLLCKFQARVKIFMFSDSCHSGTVSKFVRSNYYRMDNVRKVRDTTVRETTVTETGSSKEGKRDTLKHSNRGLDIDESDTRYYRYKDMPQEISQKTYLKNREFYENIMKGIEESKGSTTLKAWVLLISGCQDNQLSSDGTFNGLFTSAVLQVWNRGRFTGNYRTFYSKIKRLMPPNQTPNYSLIGPREGSDTFENSKLFQ